MPQKNIENIMSLYQRQFNAGLQRQRRFEVLARQPDVNRPDQPLAVATLDNPKCLPPAGRICLGNSKPLLQHSDIDPGFDHSSNHRICECLLI